jgi:hypothetical protein
MVDTVMLDAPDLVEEVEYVSMLDVEMVDLVVAIDMVDAVSSFLFSSRSLHPFCSHGNR